jgi:ADP-ribose pyrophosphatase
MRCWKTINRTQVFNQEPWIRLEAHQIELPDGRTIDDWIWIDTPDFIVVVAQDDHQRFLVFEQTKYAAIGTTLAPVGGIMKDGEDPLTAAKRELLEETGYVAEEWIELGNFMTDANRGNGRGHYFLALNATKSNLNHTSDDLEEQRLHFFTANRLRSALEQNQVQIITWQAGFAMALLNERILTQESAA